MYPHDSDTEGIPDEEGRPEPDAERLPCLQVLNGKSAGRVYHLLPAQIRVGRSHAADLSLDDTSISRLHAALEANGDGSWRVLDLTSTNGTYVNGERVPNDGFWLRDGDKIRFGKTVIAKFCWQDRMERNLHTRLYETATRDGLTGATTRAHFLERYEEDLALARRGQTPLSVMMVDIDHFKNINDTYGHPAGDRVLSDLIGRIEPQLRRHDLIARYGGEEFIVMAHLASEEALVLGERIRAAVEQELFGVPGEQEIQVTISVGIASYATGGGDLIQDADRALYAAKHGGRNRVVPCPRPTS